MTVRLLRLAIAFAYRQARRSSSRIWWGVLLAAYLVERSERATTTTRSYRVRPGKGLHVEVAKAPK